MSDHKTQRAAIGAYVLGVLDGEERATFEDHLEGCEACRREVVDLAPLPALLHGMNDASEKPPALPEDIVEGALQRIQADRHGLIRESRIWRFGTLAMAVLFALSTALFLMSGRDDTGTSEVTGPPDAVLTVAGGAEGTVSFSKRRWGVALDVELTELPAAAAYELWVLTDGGHRQRAATWGPTPARRAMLKASCSLQLGEVTAVEVTTDDGRVIANASV